jgi:uncharacterized protein involved in response to NO
MMEQAERAAAHAKGWVLFSYGFRPFFLAAFAYAFIIMVAWMAIRAHGDAPLPTLPPQLWHGHEMLFGFIAAAIAGFLLTAVPSWTGTKGFGGWPLIVLSAVWLCGRIAFACVAELPTWAVATAELAFLPALALLIGFPLLRARNRNTPLLIVLGALWFADATFLRSLALGDIALASRTLLAGIDVVLLLITVIGGRIVPAFTANALRKRGIVAELRGSRWLDGATIVAMILVLAIDTFALSRPAAVLAAGLAATLQAVRLAGWQGWRSFRDPIVWILHFAYLWLPIGLALKAVSLSTGVAWSADWLHALTVGAAATMIVAVITRASLGHTGRPLVASRRVALAYGVLGAAALVRAFATSFGSYREWAIWAASALWIAAFALLLMRYAPILMRARVDGRPG